MLSNVSFSVDEQEFAFTITSTEAATNREKRERKKATIRSCGISCCDMISYGKLEVIRKLSILLEWTPFIHLKIVKVWNLQSCYKLSLGGMSRAGSIFEAAKY